MVEEKTGTLKDAAATTAPSAATAVTAATATVVTETIGTKAKLFGKYDYSVEVRDKTLAPFISLKPLALPHSFARHANKAFAKTRVNIVERLANKLMRGGTGEKLGGKIIRTQGGLQGKKSKALKIIRDAFDALATKTKQNPLQLFVRALENTAPREDVTRIRYGGVSYQVAVDISPLRRLDLALRNIALAAITSAFNKKVSLTQALASEIELAAAGSQDSFAVKRKNDVERMAKSAR